MPGRKRRRRRFRTTDAAVRSPSRPSPYYSLPPPPTPPIIPLLSDRINITNWYIEKPIVNYRRPPFLRANSTTLLLLLFAVVQTSVPQNEAELQLYRVMQRASLLGYYDTLLEMGETLFYFLYVESEFCVFRRGLNQK